MGSPYPKVSALKPAQRAAQSRCNEGADEVPLPRRLADPECEGGARGGGPPGFGEQMGRYRFGIEDRVSPLVELDELGKDLRAEAVGAAADRVQLEPGAFGDHDAALCGPARQPRPAPCAAMSEPNTCSALAARRTAPSGCAQAPRP